MEKTLSTILKEFEKKFYEGERNATYCFEHKIFATPHEIKSFISSSLRTLLEQVVVEAKEQLDKNDPDNYGACYAIAGFNDCRQQTLDRVKKILE